MSATEAARRGDWRLGLFVAAFVLLGAGWYLPTEASLRGGLGMPLVVGWLVWAAALGLAQSRGAAVPVRWQWVDAAWLGVPLWLGLSVAVGLGQSSLEPRPALALAWQYLALAVLYAGVRVLGRGGWVEVVGRGIVALALSVSLFAFFQYAVALPALHRQYELADEATKVAMLVSAGISDTEPGSRMRELFESRLFNREPFAAFSLANTLGTLLVPVTVLAWVGLQLAVEQRRWMVAAGWAVAWAALGGAMALTSSRTALLACFLVSSVWWGWRQTAGRGHWWRRNAVEPAAFAESRRDSAKIRWWWTGTLVGLPLVLVAALWSAGQADNQLFSGAPTSIQYRWQYWVASAEMIVERPWFGCGPGSFQSAYARYQAAEASETVADPHNFFFELAATAGLPTGLLMCVAVAMTLAAQQVSRDSPSLAAPAAGPVPLNWAGPWIGLLLALAVGLGVGWLGESWPSPLWALGVSVVVAAGWWGWMESLSAGMTGVARVGLPWAWAALLIGLLASGGINYPVIGQLVFLLAALIVTAVEDGQSHERLARTVQRGERQEGRRWLVLAVAATGLATFLYGWETLPVIRAEWSMQNAQVWLRMGNLPAGQQALRTATALDPWRADGPLELAVLDLVTRSTELADEGVRLEVAAGLRRAAELRPDSSPLRRRVAEAHLQCLAQVSPRSAAREWLWSETRWWLQEAAERKPMEREVLAQLSWLAWRAGDGVEARGLAGRVRELAARNVHEDLRWERQWFIALPAELPAANGVARVAVSAGERSVSEAAGGAGAQEAENQVPLYREIRGGVPGLVEVNVASWVEWLLRGEVTAM